MGVDMGFSSVTFRPSRVFHSRVFGHLSVDTDEQSAGSCQHFDQTFKNVVTNYSCWQCLCTLLLYFAAVITVHVV